MSKAAGCRAQTARGPLSRLLYEKGKQNHQKNLSRFSVNGGGGKFSHSFGASSGRNDCVRSQLSESQEEPSSAPGGGWGQRGGRGTHTS